MELEDAPDVADLSSSDSYGDPTYTVTEADLKGNHFVIRLDYIAHHIFISSLGERYEFLLFIGGGEGDIKDQGQGQ